MGLVYLKNHYGPTPPLFEKVIDDMVKSGDAEIIKSKCYQDPQTTYLVNPTLDPDLSTLTGTEQVHRDGELQRLSDLTANELTESLHKDVPWVSAEDGKPLDDESVFYRTPDTSVREHDDPDED